ncbi:peregrin-like isoform X2 [Iris pallida]|uniref:Peregrin-like isoform X2 n=1 Tax=Iris pallida TaxID=29817 RepID=A0AAX6G3S6_IRIPA|nr:peregrin-like isoform X2 [Iris pallida]
MSYNAQDTIYYRQARVIHELAKKNFENLRQESDDNETKPKTIVRRGRPPSKNVKHTVASISVDRAASDFSSDVTLANAAEGSNLANDLSRKVTGSGMACAGVISTRSMYNLRNSEPYSWLSMYKSETNEDFPGTALKGISAMHGKKLPVADENRRNTYYQPQPSTSRRESSIFTTLDREKKHLMPQIGLKLEHAYARSLARFAAKLGPIGWAIAAKKIERVLPQGTRYGRGWIGANEAPNCSQPFILSSSPKVSSQCKIPLGTTTPQSSKHPLGPESSSTNLADEDGYSIITPPPASMSIPSSRSSSSMEVGGEPVGGSTHGGGPNLPSSVWDGNENNNIQFNSPELYQNEGLPSSANGHTSHTGKSGFSLLSHVRKVGKPVQPSGSSGSEEAMTHARALDMVSRRSMNNSTNSIHQMPKNHLGAESGKLASNLGTTISGNVLPDQGLGQDSQRSLRSLLQQPKQHAVPPDLNVRFQSPVSSSPGSMVDSKKPELGPQL